MQQNHISLENKTDDIELTKAIQEAISKKIYVVVFIGNNEIKSKISTIENVISVAPTKLKSKFLFNELDLDKNPTLFVPGEDVLSDYLLDKMTYDAGASFSTAITSGSIALILSNNRDAKKEEVITILKKCIRNQIKRRKKWEYYL